MYETSDTTAYRIALSLVLALFLHTLVVLAMASWPSPQEEDRRTVQVQLVQPGESATDSAEAVPDTPGDAAPDEQTAEDAPVQDQELTTEQSERRVPEAFAEGDDAPRRPQAPRQPMESHDPGVSSDQAIRQIFGADSPHSGDDEAPVTQLSTEDAPLLSDYELKLWEQIAREVQYNPIMDELDSTHAVVLELRLMSNGALRGVRIEESSAIEALDELAREAALRASPYPEPPGNNQGSGLRFRVELRFTPGAG